MIEIDKYIAEIREREQAATHGPWETKVFYSSAGVNDGTHNGWNPPPCIPKGKCVCCVEAGTLVKEYKDSRGQTIHIHRRESDDWRSVYNIKGEEIVGNYDYECGGVCTSEADADFIAHARADVPYLLDTIDRLTAENAHLTKRYAAAVDEIRSDGTCLHCKYFSRINCKCVNRENWKWRWEESE